MYRITYELAEELIRHLYDKTYGLRKIKDTAPEHVQKLLDLHVQIQTLMKDLEADGHDITELKQDIEESIRQRYDYEKLTIYVDGGIRDIDNKDVTSKAACGFIIYGDDEKLVESASYIGDSITLPLYPDEVGPAPTLDITVTMAEYLAVIKVLDYLLAFNPQVEHIVLYSDSDVVVNQINMSIKTRVPNLLRLRYAVNERLEKLPLIAVRKIPREQNAEVDELVNQCLDKVEAEEKVG